MLTISQFFKDMTLQCYSDAKWQYTLHQDTNRAKIVTYEKDIVCPKSSGVRYTCSINHQLFPSCEFICVILLYV
jgi:hypothetical protein